MRLDRIMVLLGTGLQQFELGEGPQGGHKVNWSGYPCASRRFAHTSILFERAMILFNGLITNDKFCMIRWGELPVVVAKTFATERLRRLHLLGYSSRPCFGVRSSHESGMDMEPTLMVRADGQRRWDIAYQLLMGWMNTEHVPERPHQQEESNGNRPVRARYRPNANNRLRPLSNRLNSCRPK